MRTAYRQALAMAGVFLAAVSGAGAEPVVVFDFIPRREALDAGDPAALRRHYDEVMLVTALQGLANRAAPRLFVRYNAAPDDYWFARMTAPGEWLDGRPVERTGSVRDLLARFGAAAKGLAVWDERVPATSNLAMTLAGTDGLLPVRLDTGAGSLYSELASGAGAMPVARSFAGMFTGNGTIPETSRASTGSAKNDAYIWLLENVVKKGRTDRSILGYYIDAFWLACHRAGALQNHTVNNMDYLVARRGAIVDLNVWEDEAPVDDPGQPPGTDLRTLREFMAAAAGDPMVAVFGFPPWAYKYTDFKNPHWDAKGKHGGVPTEWKFAEVMSAHNAYMDADALGYSSFPNASFYQHYPVPAPVPNAPPPTRERLIRDGTLAPDGSLLPVNYYAIYQGDFDSAAWVYWHFPKIWDDPARGTLPLTWAINPSLAQRFPFGMHHLRKTRADGEVFVAGEGAGYLNPTLLQAPRPAPGLPDALDAWAAHNTLWYTRWGLTVTGFNIDGNAPPLGPRGLAAYKAFSPGGIGLSRAPAPHGARDGMPFAQMLADLPTNGGAPLNDATVSAVSNLFEEAPPNFVLVRSILQSPAYYAELRRRLSDPRHLPNRLVDIPTLLWLINAWQSDPQNQDAGKRYADRPTVTATPDAPDGLRRRASGDGCAVIDRTAAPPAWVAAKERNGTYLYFGAADGFLPDAPGGTPLRIRVTYRDDPAAPLDLRLQYDSADDTLPPIPSAYKGAARVAVTQDGPARTAAFALPDARFSGRQNGGADFRLHANGATLRILRVEVAK
ncbi:MAG: hypothetical protein FWG50_01185 [Kiritimatiellaeota bacterium]|nr:hypothetical protein [Kiritimatiellota bacterium]